MGLEKKVDNLEIRFATLQQDKESFQRHVQVQETNFETQGGNLEYCASKGCSCVK